MIFDWERERALECRHALVLAFCRPWWRLFRKTHVLRCWVCSLRVVEP